MRKRAVVVVAACVYVLLRSFSQGKFPLLEPQTVAKNQAEGAGTHQLLELPLAVAQLLVHAEADLSALQRGDDLQLSVLVLDDVVLQHQTQDLARRNTTESLLSSIQHQYSKNIEQKKKESVSESYETKYNIFGVRKNIEIEMDSRITSKLFA